MLDAIAWQADKNGSIAIAIFDIRQSFANLPTRTRRLPHD
jgi:hypothetical protein